MQREREEAIKGLDSQKGAQQQDTFGHGQDVPLRCIVTEGVTADSAKADELISGTGASGVIADKGYDCDKIVEHAVSEGMKVVIPPRLNRKNKRDYDKEAYKTRRLVENAFLFIKRWRGLATGYFKNLASFVSAVHIRIFAIWGDRYNSSCDDSI